MTVAPVLTAQQVGANIAIGWLAQMLSVDAAGTVALQAPAGGAITLSASHGSIGSTLTINGSGFGATQGTSKVFFGEPQNPLGFRPATREAASYIAGQWSDARIQVTVPGMSPGKAGEPDSYHPVRVNVGGVDLGPADFYIDPLSTVTGQHFYATDAANGNSITDAHDVLYDTCIFDAQTPDMAINGLTGGMLQVNGCNRMTFLNCRTKSNMNTVSDGEGWAGVNACKVPNVSDSAGCDLSFVGCYFEACRRMGFEFVTTQFTGLTNTGMNLCMKNCTVESMGSEGISISNYWNTGLHNQLFDRVTILGNQGLAHWSGSGGGGAFEFIGQGGEFRDVHIGAVDGVVFNWEGANYNGAYPYGTNSYMYINRLVYDASLVDATQGTSHVANICSWGEINNTRWDNCRFNVDGDDTFLNASWSPASKTSNNVFNNSTICGTTVWGPAYEYCDGTCTGNVWPTPVNLNTWVGW